jgi:hypothetical protein
MENPMNGFLEEPPNVLKSEHLKEGERPIMACVGTLEQYLENGPDEVDAIEHESRDVNFFKDPQDLAKSKFKNGGFNTYAISPLDQLDKFSTGYIDCTGVVASGRDKETGEYISFLSHQSPAYFLDKDKFSTEKFKRDLKESLDELRKRSEEGTVDVAIVGGNHSNYKKSVDLLANEVKNVFGFEPVDIAGPNHFGGGDKVFYDNKNRRLYIIRDLALPSEYKNDPQKQPFWKRFIKF